MTSDNVAIQSRLEIVDGLLRAFDHRAEIDTAIERAEDRADALRRLTGPGFHFTTVQAHHILDMTLGRRTQLGRTELRREQERLRAAIWRPG